MSVLSHIRLRDFSADDIPKMVDYWYRSPPGFVESLGIDPSRMISEREMLESLKATCAVAAAESKSTALTILDGDHAVGIHLINQIAPGESAVFHAHLWEPDLRGKGICSVTYPLACEAFILRFDLRRILFKTPLKNTAAIRLKEKLGIRCTGEEPMKESFVCEGTRARCFELTRAELERLLGRPLADNLRS